MSKVRPGAGKKKRIRRAVLFMAFITAGIYLFLLFEPILVWVYGWKPLPGVQEPPLNMKTYDETYSEEISAAQSELINAREELNAPAFSAAVGVGGALVWAGAVGYADLARLTPATVESRFRIGSTSKAVTSMAVAKLMQDGKLDIDADIRTYVDYFPPKQYVITMRQLLSHMAGIRDYRLCLCFPVWEYYNQRHYPTVEVSVDIFANDPLLFKPGSHFKYTSYGFNLVSAVVEGASGQEFLTYMQQAVFTPLEMRATSADYNHEEVPDRVVFYDIENGQYKEVYRVDNSSKWAGGGFVSTPGDLVKMGNALLGDRHVDKEIVDELLTPQTLDNGEINPDSYALGWRSHDSKTLLVNGEPVHVAHHGGVAQGSLSFLVLLPEEKIVVSVLANRGQQGSFPMAKFAYAIARPFVERLRSQMRTPALDVEHEQAAVLEPKATARTKGH